MRSGPSARPRDHGSGIIELAVILGAVASYTRHKMSNVMENGRIIDDDDHACETRGVFVRAVSRVERQSLLLYAV
jgi:hypothetical protein